MKLYGCSLFKDIMVKTIVMCGTLQKDNELFVAFLWMSSTNKSLNYLFMSEILIRRPKSTYCQLEQSKTSSLSAKFLIITTSKYLFRQ